AVSGGRPDAPLRLRLANFRRPQRTLNASDHSELRRLPTAKSALRTTDSPRPHNRSPWIPLRPPLSSSRSPVSLAEPAPVVVSPSAVSNSWTTRPDPSSATSRAQSARTTFSAYSSLSARPGVCDKRTSTRAAAFHSVSEFFAKAMGIYTDFMRMSG
ncbi:hypothetical protein J1614_005913, partial [Plenodomus biglobosus]